jgi:hypothetical protein
MTVQASLIRPVDGTVLYDLTFGYRGGSRKFTDWGANDAQAVREELARGYRSLAEKIVDEVFLLYPMPGIEAVSMVRFSPAIFGLRPEYPEVKMRYASSRRDLVSVEVDSLQPTLRWESFPRPQDRDADKEGELGRIRNVTYDLKIWRTQLPDWSAYPVEVVYARQGLPEPSQGRI